MPNYVINKLGIYGDKELVRKIFDTVVVKDNDGREYFDFNRIIPQPESIANSICSSEVDKGLRHWLKYNEGDDLWYKISEMVSYVGNKAETYSKEEVLLGQKAVNNIRRYGYKDWYDWNRANWGTKWNAITTDVEGDTIIFQTAWSHPELVIKKLSEMFPDATFDLDYADEDIGSNCGSLEYINGELQIEHYPDDATAFAERLWRYEYNGEEDENA